MPNTETPHKPIPFRMLIALAAPLLKEKGIPVILGPVLTLPTREDQFHAFSYQAAGELALSRSDAPFEPLFAFG